MRSYVAINFLEHALHENVLLGVSTQVSSQEQRAIVVSQINRESTGYRVFP